MRRAAILLILAVLLATPAAAPGQSDPFSPIPGPAPQATPVPEPAAPSGDGELGRTTLALIGAAVLLSFFGIGWAIMRDARRSLTERDRESLERKETAPAPGRARADRATAKRRARERAKAQRAARRRNR